MGNTDHVYGNIVFLNPKSFDFNQDDNLLYKALFLIAMYGLRIRLSGVEAFINCFNHQQIYFSHQTWSIVQKKLN